MIYDLSYQSANGEIVFSMRSGFVIEKAQSFDEQTVEFSTSQSASELGDTVDGQRVRGKVLRFSGTLLGEAEAKRRQMLHVIAPKQRGKLIFNGTHVMTVWPQNTPQIERYPNDPKFTFTLYAPFPFWGLVDYDSAMLVGIERAFRFPFNPHSPNPFKFSNYTKAAYVHVLNTGEVETTWRATMTAVQETNNPYISNYLTGQHVRLWATLAPGESAVIDTTGDEMTVTMYDAQGNATDAFRKLDIDSYAFPLLPGDNLITCGSDDAGVVMHAQMVWQPAISGV